MYHSDNKHEFVAGTPIYITIPIYINTAGKVPISLTIGEQELPLHQQQQRLSTNHKTRNHQTKSPNSYFNRLLQPIEPPKRRTTNRHRSQSRSKIQALKEKKNEKQLEKDNDAVWKRHRIDLTLNNFFVYFISTN